MTSLLSKYKQILFDFDGVLFDTNHIKKQNIFDAAKLFVEVQIAQEFTQYFTANNGIPREKKIFLFFQGKEHIANNILKTYNNLNNNLDSAMPINGVREFLEQCKSKNKIIISGGDYNEIMNLLWKNNLDKYFQSILCGPLTKDQNFKKIDLNKSTVFFGDSFHDYEVAQKYSVDFIFVYGVSQDTRNEKLKSNSLLSIQDFTFFK